MDTPDNARHCHRTGEAHHAAPTPAAAFLSTELPRAETIAERAADHPHVMLSERAAEIPHGLSAGIAIELGIGRAVASPRRSPLGLGLARAGRTRGLADDAAVSPALSAEALGRKDPSTPADTQADSLRPVPTAMATPAERMARAAHTTERRPEGSGQIATESPSENSAENLMQALGTAARPAAELILDTLLALGVDTVFGYPGGAVLPLYDALHARPQMRHVLVRHEQAAVHAAEGYARSTGRVGVVLVTSGPGLSNTTTGLLDALSDSVPILCLSGQVASTAIGTDAFQECDALGITRPVTKWNTQVRDARDVPRVLHQALAVTAGGRPGPVLVDVPKDIQRQVLKPADCTPVKLPRHVRGKLQTPKLPRQRLQEAAQLIARAERPVLYGGGGLVNSGLLACERFTRLAQLANLPCTLTLMGLGAYPASDPQFIGMLGMHGTLEANMAMHGADLVVCVGARFDDRVTGQLSRFCPGARFIHIDIDPASIHKVVRAEMPLVGDAAAMLQGLLDELVPHPLDAQRLAPWWARIEGWRAERSLGFVDTPEAIAPPALMRQLRAALQGRDAIVSTDVGQHQMWAAQHLAFEAPRRWLTSGGAGTMGYGLPAAIGAQLAHPDHTVVCVSGDASVLMNIQELATAMQHRAPVKLVLCNNGRMGMVRQWQELIHGGRYSHSYNEALPDFCLLAQAFGWRSQRVEHRAELDDAIAECLNSAGPFLLDVVVSPDENCFPMIPAGCGHDEVLLGKDRPYRDA